MHTISQQYNTVVKNHVSKTFVDFSLWQGTGLGLVISQRLVEYMGGRIWLTSTPNEGTQFCFTTKVQQRRRLSQNLVENTQRVARMITFFCVSTNERMHACMRGLLFHLGATKVNMVTSQGELSILLDMVNTNTSGAAQVKSAYARDCACRWVLTLCLVLYMYSHTLLLQTFGNFAFIFDFCFFLRGGVHLIFASSYT